MPPLSAMNKYEKSTKVSELDAMDASVTKRAATNMDVRTENIDVQLSINNIGKGDPFYSQEMVKLADEARN